MKIDGDVKMKIKICPNREIILKLDYKEMEILVQCRKYIGKTIEEAIELKIKELMNQIINEAS